MCDYSGDKCADIARKHMKHNMNIVFHPLPGTDSRPDGLPQKGFTITRMTMPIISTVGTSFTMRKNF